MHAKRPGTGLETFIPEHRKRSSGKVLSDRSGCCVAYNVRAGAERREQLQGSWDSGREARLVFRVARATDRREWASKRWLLPGIQMRCPGLVTVIWMSPLLWFTPAPKDPGIQGSVSSLAFLGVMGSYITGLSVPILLHLQPPPQA